MASAVTPQSFHKNFVSSKERDAFMFNKEFMSDCAFVVEEGDEKLKIPCHKYILGCCSWEFYNLFYLLTAESSDIPIVDVSSNVVEMFVEFVYKETTVLDMETVWDVLKLAKRFDVKKLISFCEIFISENVADENLFEVIENSTDFDFADKLKTECVKLLGRSQIDYFKPDIWHPFFELSKEGLAFILKSDHMDKEEIEIFRFVNSWAENRCVRQNKPINSLHKRLFLGDVVKHIRFGTLTFVEFGECTNNESILTYQQITDVFNCIVSNGEQVCQFPAVKRLPTKTKILFGSCFDYQEYRKLQDVFILSVNRPKILIGFGILGSRSACNQKLVVQIRCSDDVIYESNEEIQFDGSQKIYDLLLNKDMILKGDQKYCITLGNGDYSNRNIYFFSNTKKEYISGNDGAKITIHSSCFNFAFLLLQ